MHTTLQRNTFSHCLSVEHQKGWQQLEHSSSQIQKLGAVHHEKGVPGHCTHSASMIYHISELQKTKELTEIENSFSATSLIPGKNATTK